jgi:hypothetical protein
VRDMGAGESNLGFAVADWFAGGRVGGEMGAKESNLGAGNGILVIGPTVKAKESNLGAAVVVQGIKAGGSNSSLADGGVLAKESRVGVSVNVGTRGSNRAIGAVAGFLDLGESAGNGELVNGGNLCAGCDIGLETKVGAKPLAMEKCTVCGTE